MKKCAGYLAACVLGFVLAAPAGAAGLLPEEHVPQGLEFLPPPPAEGSVGLERDREIYRRTRAARGTDLWRQAAFDADSRLDGNAGKWFLEVFGMAVDKKKTPVTYRLLSALNAELRATYRPAKTHYRRMRPFAYHDAPGSTCAPEYETFLEKNASYPSGHAARGWGMALVLSELSPERQGAILKRGYEIGQSRVICGVHWQSDVDAGRMAAAATVVQLHNSAAFRELLDKAREEIREQRRTAR